MLVTQAAILAMPGVPGIYFHSLVGSKNYHDGVKHSGINRTINREKLRLKTAWNTSEFGFYDLNKNVIFFVQDL